MRPHKCKHCGNRYHWNHAFSKFGYDDGNGNIETPAIAHLLETAGYRVKYERWCAHNVIITSIQKDGIELMPLLDQSIRIGYDDPKSYLPEPVQAILESKIPFTGIFPY
mgnify:CR=1 FL=1|tara:strand:+ start:2650 stop:2976 length:327 start_codon:yes stop_codon:yes gene_type:complete